MMKTNELQKAVEGANRKEEPPQEDVSTGTSEDEEAGKESEKIAHDAKAYLSFSRFRRYALYFLYGVWVLTFVNFICAFLYFIGYFIGFVIYGYPDSLAMEYVLISSGFFVIGTAAIIAFVFGKNSLSGMPAAGG